MFAAAALHREFPLDGRLAAVLSSSWLLISHQAPPSSLWWLPAYCTAAAAAAAAKQSKAKQSNPINHTVGWIVQHIN